MIHSDLLNDAALKKLLRIVPEKEYLFTQGERGNTIFIVLEGEVVLTHKTLNLVRIVETLGPGQILGEKAALSDHPYRRTMTAQAKTEVAVLEFDFKEIKLVQAKVPNFTHQILRFAIQRLDKANDLIGVLQLKDDSERFAQYLLFLCKHHGTKTPQGDQFCAIPSEIYSNLNVSESYIDAALKLLARQKILTPVPASTHEYVLSDPSALLAALSTIKQKIAA